LVDRDWQLGYPTDNYRSDEQRRIDERHKASTTGAKLLQLRRKAGVFLRILWLTVSAVGRTVHFAMIQKGSQVLGAEINGKNGAGDASRWLF
jgi:hypothetical protein